MGSLEIDYSNPDQEFYLRIFTEFEQLATMLAHGLNYIDRPVRKQGTLSFDFSEGKYKLDDEYLTNGQLFEFMENNQWHIGKLHLGVGKHRREHAGHLRGAYAEL